MILSDGGANTISCMSIDGLMLVVEKIVQGENIHRIDFPGVQKEAEKMESRRQAQNVIMQAKQNEERLDIALKVRLQFVFIKKSMKSDLRVKNDNDL